VSNPTIFGMPPVNFDESMLGDVSDSSAHMERSEIDAPPPPPRRPSAVEQAPVHTPGEVDLPAGVDLELDDDLPAPAGGPPMAPDVDLPAPVDLDLPAPAELDLPAPADLDLPAPADLDLPAPVDLDLPAPADLDLPAPADNLLAPVDDLPAPAEILPTPAENLPTPAEILPTPVDEEGGDLELDLDIDEDAADDASGSANLVDAHEGGRRRPAARVAGPTGAVPESSAPMTSPAPKAAKPGVSRAVIYGGLAAVLVVGGGAAAYVAGVFDQDEVIQADNTDSENQAPPKVPAGEVAERSEQVLAKLDEDSPAGYQQAMAISEQAGDRVGQAEAALLMHLRYGPDGVLAGQAQGLLEPYADKQEAFVRRVFGLGALAGGNLDAAAEQLKGDDPRSRLYRSWVALERGELDEAKAETKLVLEQRPNDKAAALTALRVDVERDPENGLDALRKAADADPNHASLQHALVEALFERGLLAEASERAEKLQIPGAAGAGYKAALLTLRADIASERGDRAAALRLLEQASAVSPNPEAAKLDRLEVLLRYGDYAGVRKDLEAMLHGNEGLVRGQLLMAELSIATGEGDQALAALAKVTEKNPKSAKAAELRGRVFSMRMKVDEAQAAFAKARELDPEMAEATIGEAMLLAKLDRDDEAIALLDGQRAALNERKGSAARTAGSALLRTKAELQREAGDDAQALETLDAAVALNSADNQAALDRALALRRLGRAEDSEKALLALHERTGGYPGLTGPLGRVYLRTKALDQLEQLIGNQLDDAQASDDILTTGALLRLHQDKLDQAKGLIDRVMARTPDSWEGHMVRCQILIRQGDYDGALLAIEQSRPNEPNAEVELWTGQAKEYAGDPKGAMDHYARALEIQPTLDEAAALYGRLLAYSGAAKQAIGLLEPVVERTQDYPYAYAALGRALYDLGKAKEAIGKFQKAYELDPELFEAYYWEGRIQGDRNQHAAAVKALSAGVKIASPNEPYIADAYRRLGDAQRSLGRDAEARGAYEKYLEVAPPNAPGRTAVKRILGSL
jgi:tetratricopeptide (TPR) repeat protein